MKVFALLCCGLLCVISNNIQAQNNLTVRPKSISIPDAKPETNPPSVSIEYPRPGQRVGQSSIQTLIKATDDTRVESFQFSVNGTPGNWIWAPGLQWPWGASIQLNPGTNSFSVLCADYWGNMASASVTFVYAPGSDLSLDIENGGEVTPNYQGQALNPGQTYSMTARPSKGFRFKGWTGSVSNNHSKLKFVMQPNLSLTAGFIDVSRPVDIITFPRANRTVTAINLLATGKAADNSSVTNVYYRLNGSGWDAATSTNSWTNWESGALSPLPGHNVLESYAVDDSGNCSRTNRVKFKY
jgi:hypothetical protein